MLSLAVIVLAVLSAGVVLEEGTTDARHPLPSAFEPRIAHSSVLEQFSRAAEPVSSLDGQCQHFDGVTGFGVIGDSGSDEYRADDNRGGAFARTTLNWVEILASRRGLNFGLWGTWGGPRRSGFEYNWSRSGATTDDMIRNGQHLGLAAQVAAGKVSYAFIRIGINDFQICCGDYAEIYNGTLSDHRLDEWLDRKVENYTQAIDTLQAAGDVQIFLTNVPDPGFSPEVIGAHPEPVKRQRVSDAVDRLNVRLAALAADRGIVLLDFAGWAVQGLSRVGPAGLLQVDSIALDARRKGNDPHFLRLDDAVGHAGTVVSAYYANDLGVRPLRETFGLCIEPLSERDILETAGIVSGS